MTECKICRQPLSRDPEAERLLSLEHAPEEQRIYRCGHCGSRFIDPPLSPPTLKSLYENSYFEDSSREYSYSDQVSEELISYEVNARTFSNLIGEGSILDIGCATGEFLELAESLGLKGVGVDVSEYAVEKAKEKGIEAQVAAVDDLAGWSRIFDGVNMGHVLEHLDDPRGSLETVRSLLRKGGVLYLEVPNQFNSVLDWISVLRGNKPPEFSVFSVHHRVFFTCDSIRMLLEECGFEVLELTTFRKEKRTRGFKRKVVLNFLLKIASLFNRGDVISIWARAK